VHVYATSLSICNKLIYFSINEKGIAAGIYAHTRTAQNTIEEYIYHERA